MITLNNLSLDFEGSIIFSGLPEDVVKNQTVKSSYLGESFKLS